jgi:hypothetical protein
MNSNHDKITVLSILRCERLSVRSLPMTWQTILSSSKEADTVGSFKRTHHVMLCVESLYRAGVSPGDSVDDPDLLCPDVLSQASGSTAAGGHTSRLSRRGSVLSMHTVSSDRLSLPSSSVLGGQAGDARAPLAPQELGSLGKRTETCSFSSFSSAGLHGKK